MKALILTITLTFVASTAYAGDPTTKGDVVGRRLDSKWVGAAGHVGIYAGSLSVVEVLNKAQVVQKNSLDSFKKATTYWGAKYDSRKTGYAGTVPALAYDQRNFNPTYTSTSKFVWGEYKQVCAKRNKIGKCTRYKNSMVPAKFRCDTFIDAAYARASGNGVYIIGPGPTNVVTPALLYQKLDSERK